MGTKNIQIYFQVFLDDMKLFYKEAPILGSSKETPYPADDFTIMHASGVQFTGPNRNIIIFEGDTTYEFFIQSNKSEVIDVTLSADEEMELIMFEADAPKKWSKIFEIGEHNKIDGDKLIAKGQKNSKACFELNTIENPLETIRMKFSFYFEFKDIDGNTKFAKIDPNGETHPPLPPGF